MRITFLLTVLFVGAVSVAAAGPFITLASTTSTQNSGLLAAILPQFTKKTGIEVHVVAVGTGQALRIARNGDADVLLVHHRPSEDAFVAAGHGIERRDVMFNDFVIIGPRDDPAEIRDSASAIDAFRKIAATRRVFASRADDSGTNLREMEIWDAAGIEPRGSWYLETGAGMGATLNLSSVKNAYLLSDRGTWISFGNKGNLEILHAGDPALFNPYGIILVNPARHPYAKIDLARIFENWLLSPAGQRAIGAFRIGGVQAFCPDAEGLSDADLDRGSCPIARQ